jgi:glycosyltransferase involved in cell wall biosynthesis
VVRLLEDGEARARLGQAAQAMVARDFTWQAAGDHLDALLRQ